MTIRGSRRRQLGGLAALAAIAAIGSSSSYLRASISPVALGCGSRHRRSGFETALPEPGFLRLVANIIVHAGRPSAWVGCATGALVYLGSISYGIYLYHHFMFEIYLLLLADITDGRSALGVDLAKVGLSIVVSRRYRGTFIEQPMLALQGSFSYRAPPAVAGRAEVWINDIRGVQPG